MADEQIIQESYDDVSLFDVLRAGVGLLLILAAVACRKYVTESILTILKSVTGWTEETHKNTKNVVAGPLSFLTIMSAIYLAGEICVLPDYLDILLGHAHRTFLQIVVFYVVYQAVTPVSYLLQVTSTGITQTEIRQVSEKVARVLVFFVGVLSILDTWGFNVGAFLAGLGLAGMAVALAAQDTMKNFFGTIVVLSDDIFHIGDWIKTPQVEGIVEHFGLRTTLIRGFDTSQISIPNATLADTTIINFSRCTQRQVSWTLPIVGANNHNFETVVERFHKYLHDKEEVSKDRLLIVAIDNFGCACMEVFVYFFTKETKWLPYMEIKEKIILDFNKIVEEAECRFGLPTVAAILN